MNTKAWAACALALAATTSAQALGLGLDRYQLSATYGLGPLASEASAVTWNSNSNTLFIVGDEGEAIVEVNKQGVQLGSMRLSGFDDTEGLTYIGGGQFVIAEERLQDLYKLSYTAGGTVSRGGLQSVSLGLTVGNIGIEGISYDASNGRYIVVKEKSPQGVWDATLDFAGGTGSYVDLFVPNLGVADIGDVQVLSNGNLLIFSQESSRLLEVTRGGSVLGSFDFSGIADNVEGVTIDADGNIFLVGENPELDVLTAVPEPETYGLMLLGLGVVGWFARRRRAAAALLAGAALLPAAASAQMRITEWAYQGNGGEYIEFTNVGSTAIDMSGWSFDDDSRNAGTVSLSAFGIVAAGESVILAEADAGLFAGYWGLSGTKVIGDNTTNLGRNDEINIYDASNALVDRLTYGDQTFPGSPRTQNVSGVYTGLGALGANDISQWAFSTLGDAHGGRLSSVGDLGSVGSALLPVPEPGTYALMLVGLAAVAVSARRSR